MNKEKKIKVVMLASDNTITCKDIELSEEEYHRDLNYLLNAFKSVLKYYPLRDKEIAEESFEAIIKDYKENYNPPAKKQKT